MREAIHTMNRKDLKMVMQWAENEGWNPGKFDYLSYYSMDEEAFLLLSVNDKPIGSISVVRYSLKFAFIGLFIVLPDYRNKGYGTKLWNKAMEYLSQYKSVGLYSVPQQINRYARFGFSDEERVNHRLQLSNSIKYDISSFLINQTGEIKNPLTIYQKMISLDEQNWGASRRNFFNSTLSNPSSFAFVSLDDVTGEVDGYGLIRPCVKGYRIGPLYCANFESAKSITYALMSKVPKNSQIIFDVPCENKFSSLFSEYFQLIHVNNANTKAMFKGEAHHGSENICYGVASLEIG